METKIKNYLVVLGLGMLALSSCKSTKEHDMVASNFSFAGQQLKYALTKVEEGCRINEALTHPRSIKPDGSLDLVASKDWTSGFFPGELWYVYEYTHDPYWKEQAQKQTELLEREKLNGKTHDMGFKMYCSYGNGYRLTANPIYKEVLLQSAQTLSTRFNPMIGCIRSWDHHAAKWQFPVIIDNMMNLELMFWAFRETNDSTYYHIAVSHARTTLKNHFREDNSSYHVVEYDTITGSVRSKVTHQGYADESAWARGQAWALYGYTMCYRETGMPEFLQQARQVERYIFTHPTMPEDLIPYWDFNAPEIPKEPRDASAASCIASALYELSTYVPEKKEQYKQDANRILQNLTDHYRVRPNEDNGFLLLHSTGSKPHQSEIDVPLVYADYYFLEALIRKNKLEKGESLF